MKRVPVSSSVLRSVGYEPRRLLLEVEFTSGDVYDYLDVPPNEHTGLMAAPSKGIYFNANIRERYASVKT